MEANYGSGEQKKEIKREIRKQILTMRDNTDSSVRARKSSQICERVRRDAWYRQADVLLCYVNYKSEVETIPLIRHALRQKKRVYCPAVTKTEMEFYEIRDFRELQKGFQGILEPVTCAAGRFRMDKDCGERTLMIMPGAVFDCKCHRIGYGGGFYDRYLKKNGTMRTVALCYSFQLLEEEIPCEAHDVCPQKIITEKGACVLYGTQGM